MGRFFLHTALFFVTLALIFFVAYMGHYSIIQSEVRSRSRCLRAKQSYAAGGQYDVKAIDDQGTGLYKSTYDLAKKQVATECACPKGDTINHFKGVKMYDLKTASSRKIDDLMCNCDMAYDTVGADVFYDGHPGLVRYMQNSDESFFTTDLSGAIASKIVMPANPAGSSISVNAYLGETPLYTVAYNTKTLSTSDATLVSEPYKISCKCPAGTVDNTFTINVYNKSRGVTKVKHNCKCDAAYTTSPNIFTGTQGLVDFMKNNTNKKIFDNMKTSA